MGGLLVVNCSEYAISDVPILTVVPVVLGRPSEACIWEESRNQENNSRVEQETKVSNIFMNIYIHEDKQIS